MILLLDTATPVCRLTLVGGAKRYEASWEAGRELAYGLLEYIESELASQEKSFSDLTAIGALRGPGSFTGLRIGLTVLNTLADSLGLPIVGETGDDWQENALQRLSLGETDRLVLPEYGAEANITKPRK